MPDIVITGTGLITAAGRGARPVLDLMDNDRTAVTDRSGIWPAATIRLAEQPWPEGSAWANVGKYANAAAHGAVAAAGLALDRAGRSDTSVRAGTVMAVGSTGSDELAEEMPRLAALARTDPRPLARMLYEEVPDYSYIRGIPSQLGQFVSLAAGFRGSNVAVYGEAGAGGMSALAVAVRLLEAGELDRVLVAGVAPPLSATATVTLDQEEAVALEAQPGAGPFDLTRAGTLLGQAAAAVVLERSETATAPPLARVLAAETIGARDRVVAAREAVDLALAAGPRRADLWWAHGAGTVGADADECQAVLPAVPGVPVTTSKATIGNPFECSGIVDLILAVATLRRGVVPPVGLLQKLDPALGSPDVVQGDPRAVPGLGTVLLTTLSHGTAAPTAGAALITREGL
ncbi:beta-ketoacyl synthase N-terminal-like domain-containing protein [Actinoplanes sp. RD1]|uniref:beta-ketoacyl synthase N-terminal-like domain-containing protein n=1 Tax=Actinoplanes sp. RD1 TaxID=3064538 RepID=UPI0027407E55|nr:beta-ketoacyl synthase N-terminal-like domain-containing protein [Actinoplanes sp. RD1]